MRTGIQLEFLMGQLRAAKQDTQASLGDRFEAANLFKVSTVGQALCRALGDKG